MAKFEYQARDQLGQLQVGFVEADTKDGAANKLYADNLYVLAITEIRKNTIQSFVHNFINRVKQKDLMIFTRQFATLLSSGVSLSESLRTLAAQTRNPILRETVIEIQKEIDSGLSLSQAMEKYNNVFSDFYVNMIRSAEVTGRVDEVTSFVADYLEKQTVLSSKVRNALVYPVFMVSFLVLVIIFMAVVVFPQIESVFTELGATLPLLTKMVISFGKFLSKWWWAIIAGIIASIFVFKDYFKSKEGKTLLDKLILRVPVFNRMLKSLYVSRFADSVSVLTKGGVAIVQALEITARTMGSALYGNILRASADDVKNGVLLSQSLSKYPLYFPPIVAQMLAVGETTGQMDVLLQKISVFYGREVEDLVGSLVELIQPILMLVIGAAVGLMFASILTPIFNFISTGLNQ
jgi:type IV pilus assembly protein PilC